MTSNEYTPFPSEGDSKQTHQQQLFLLLFSQALPEFRWAEFETICQLYGIQKAPDLSSDQSHLQLVYFTDGEILVKHILERAVLLKSAYHLLSEASSHQIILDQLKAQPSFIKCYNNTNQSWCFQTKSINRKQSQRHIQTIVQEYTSSLQLDQAPVDLGNPLNTFTLFELFNDDEHNEQPTRVFLTRLIGEGQIHLKIKYCLSKRCYIGNSTMDPELAFIMANLGMANFGTLIMDPFCGTGGILLAAAHFGAHVLGAEIKWDVAWAKGKSSRAGEFWLTHEQSIRANFVQYGLDDGRFLGVLLADSSKHQIWRNGAGGMYDAILADPPYGIRERCQKLGIVGLEYKQAMMTERDTIHQAKNQKDINKKDNEFHGYPEKRPYEISSAFLDLMDLGAHLLRPYGRLVFWFPVCKSEYSERILPRNECMQLLYNCEQSLTKESARRLLVYQKIRHPRMDSESMGRDVKAYFVENCYQKQTFRQKVFNNNKGTNAGQ